MTETKKTLTITLEVRELMYDIRNKAWLTGQAREAAQTANFAAASGMQMDDDDGNGYQLRRSLANAFATLKVVIGEYLDGDTTSADNKIGKIIDNDGQLTLTLSLPTNYNAATADAVCNGAHAYLVDTALAEWLTITDKNDAEDYATHAATSLEIMRRALYRRTRPDRPEY